MNQQKKLKKKYFNKLYSVTLFIDNFAIGKHKLLQAVLPYEFCNNVFLQNI